MTMRWIRPWWRDEIDDARASADRAEREKDQAVERRKHAERIDEHARGLEEGLRNELLRNGFADALRQAFGSTAS